MEKKNRFIVNSSMLGFALVYITVLLAVGITLFFIGRPVSGAVFTLLALPFCVIAFRYGSLVILEDDCVRLVFLGIERMRISWDEVAEILVAGSRVMNRGNKDKCGTLYMVFSKEELDEDKRFDLMLRWPPKGKIYMHFDKERFMAVQLHYAKPVEKYNIGTLDI